MGVWPTGGCGQAAVEGAGPKCGRGRGLRWGRGLNVGVGVVRLWAGSARRGWGLKKDVGG